jgi:chromosome segregation ATPase
MQFSTDDARAAWEALTKEERAVYDQIKKYCADLRTNGKKPKRFEVREHVKRNMEFVCDLMRIIDVLETSDAPFRGPVEPTISADVSEIAAEQKAAADRTEHRMQDLLRRERAEATELTERAAQAVIDGLKATIRDQAEKMADDEQVIASLCSDLSAARKAASEISIRMEQVVSGEGDARSKIEALVQAKAEAETRASRCDSDASAAQAAAERSAVEKACAERERDETRRLEIDLRQENAALAARHDLVLESNRKLETQLARLRQQCGQVFEKIGAP